MEVRWFHALVYWLDLKSSFHCWAQERRSQATPYLRPWAGLIAVQAGLVPTGLVTRRGTVAAGGRPAPSISSARPGVGGPQDSRRGPVAFLPRSAGPGPPSAAPPPAGVRRPPSRRAPPARALVRPSSTARRFPSVHAAGSGSGGAAVPIREQDGVDSRVHAGRCRRAGRGPRPESRQRRGGDELPADRGRTVRKPARVQPGSLERRL